MEQNNNKSGKINSLLDTTLSKIRELVDSQTVIGEPITVSPRLTLIPISKMSYGFASGGSDFDGKSGHRCFGGGGGAGVTVQPVAFLVITPTNVRLLQIDNNMNSLDKAVGMIPNLVDQVSSLLAGVKDKKKEEEPEPEEEEEPKPTTEELLQQILEEMQKK